jgi:hypothetical protein
MENKEKIKLSDISKCPFCDMGNAKRAMIWRLTNNLSRKSLRELRELIKPKRKI